jgi:hypothetical protein
VRRDCAASRLKAGHAGNEPSAGLTLLGFCALMHRIASQGIYQPGHVLVGGL